MMRWAVALAGGALLAALAVAGYRHLYPDLDAPMARTMAILDARGTVLGQYRTPSAEEIRGLPNADSVMLGRRLLNETARLLPDNVGNALNCNACHMAEGKRPLGNHYLNAGSRYPRYMPRPGREIDLADRINGCLQRSMNGRPLAKDAPAMVAMLDYMHWLNRGLVPGSRVAGLTEGPIDSTLSPDPARGQVLYAAQCAACHGAQGEGQRDASGDMAFPPLWGDDSFNIGAGMARLYKAAAFVKHNMPPAATLEPPLGQAVMADQDAVDIAAYFTAQPRPDFAGKGKDWQHDPKPKDARY
ncbi:c-type cytochrome [Stenotrophomonas sp. 24(2023)]|uniref:c-type cytochrome n=1 Tax=Stenotrophomonas sp. 24(2023) TaxID=3068324 RepID=UPI0027E05A81|nr:c-type cytochrome [Stenotrophomonas sp. 24(2023)]WMJ68725.1 c-type cytochrome [Stenotrophomonas sp. 24(2023)]